MASLPIRRIEARVHCHGTENETRVVHALDVALPGGETDRDVLEGHFGNPIVRLTRRVEDLPGLRGAWARWHEAGVAAVLERDLPRRLDEDGVLHLRLDKQAACLDRIVLASEGDAIDVAVKLKAYPAKPEEFARAAKALFEGGM